MAWVSAEGQLTASLAPLTVLTNLSLVGSTLNASHVLQLPRSLRCLRVDFALPQQQLRRLTCLEALALRLGEPLAMPSTLTALRLFSAQDHAAVCAQLSLLQTGQGAAGSLRRLELGFRRDVQYTESPGPDHEQNDGRGFCDLGPCLPLIPPGVTALRLDGLRRLHIPTGLQQLAKLQVLQIGAELVLTSHKGQPMMGNLPGALVSVRALGLGLPPKLARAVAASAPQSRNECLGAAAARELVADLQAFRGADELRAVVVREASGCPWGPELLPTSVSGGA